MQEPLLRFVHQPIPAEEQRRVLFAEGVEAPIGANRGRLGGRDRAGLLARRGASHSPHDGVQRVGVIQSTPEVGVGVQQQEAAVIARLTLGQEDGDDGEGRLSRLAVKRQGHLAPLPAPEPVRTEEDDHPVHLAERPLQRLEPVEPEAQALSIVEDRDSSRPQQRTHRLDRRAVPTVIAQEQIDRRRVRRFIPPGRFLKIEAHRSRLPSVRHRERSSSRK